MRARWLGVAALAVVLICGYALVNAQVETFPFERAQRVERIDYEIRQVAVEQQRLVDERRELVKERACVGRAQDRQAIKRCAQLRP